MKVLTDNKYYGQIADVIREQNGTSNTYTPLQMVRALKDLFYEEVEGVPPISFNGIGENLLDYRIDGASGGVGDRTKNLFNFNEWSENLVANANNELIISNNSITITAVENDAFTVPYFANHPNIYKIDVLPNSQYVLSWDSNNTLPGAIYVFKNGIIGSGNYVSVNNATQKYITFSTDGNTTFITIRFGVMNAGDSITYSHIQLEEGSTATDYEPYGYKVPVVINGKNLLQNTASSQTINGVTFTVNNDGSIICNGTSSAVTTFAISIKLNSNINYILSGSPKNGGFETYRLDLRNSSYSVYNNIVDNGDGINFTIEENGTYLVCIRIAVNYTCNNLTFYPMIRLTTIEDDTYEQYIEPTTTNIYLDEPIEGKANIPSEYEEVEYIESTGTQYINTGFKLNTNCRIVFDYYLSALVSFSPFGSFQNQNSIGFTAYTTGNNSRFGTFATNNLTGNYNQYQIKNRAHFEYSKNGLYQNGSLVYSITTNDAVSNYNCFIFARNANDVATGLGNIRMYYFKIYDNDSLVFDGVPCYRKSDNVAGLYDLVNNVFYTNQGTENFIVGPIKENESITLSDTNVDIPTIRGTNVLTVDTTVQPSNVYVKSRHESSYETIMRERYEEAQAQLDALN